MTLPITIFCWLLLAVRLIRFRSTPFDRRFNLLLALLAEHATTHDATLRTHLSALTGGRLSAGVIYQSSAVAFIFTAAVSLLLAALMLRRSLSPALIYGLAAISGAAALLLDGIAQGPSPNTMYDRPGWGQFAFWAAMAPLTYWMIGYLGTVCLLEMRKQRHTPRERAVHGLILVITNSVLFVFTLYLVAAAVRATGHRNWLTDLHLIVDHNAVFLQILPFLGIGLIPVLAWFADTTGLDTWSRHRRRLLPLWSALTAACPEIVHQTSAPADTRRSRYLLHRAVIEIRDSALLLTRHSTPPPPWLQAEINAVTHTDAEREALDIAVRLVRACAAKSRGDLPASACALPHAAGCGLLDEAATLAAIAEQWPRACALVNGAAVRV